MKTFSLLQVFSLVDGRLSTNVDDVYEMLGTIYDSGVMTHDIPPMIKYLHLNKPNWFKDAEQRLGEIKEIIHTDDFKTMIAWINLHDADTFYDVKKLSDELLIGFGEYLGINSLLK